MNINKESDSLITSDWTIKKAAEYLGVSIETLRRWDKIGKFKAKRHPINGYRIYRPEKVLELNEQIKK